MKSWSSTGRNYFLLIVFSHKRSHLRTMPLHANLVRKTFRFAFDVRTSRGTMKERTSWFLNFYDDSDENVVGVGECGPLAGLSEEFTPDYEDRLRVIVGKINE